MSDHNCHRHHHQCGHHLHRHHHHHQQSGSGSELTNWHSGCGQLCFSSLARSLTKHTRLLCSMFYHHNHQNHQKHHLFIIIIMKIIIKIIICNFTRSLAKHTRLICSCSISWSFYYQNHNNHQNHAYLARSLTMVPVRVNTFVSTKMIQTNIRINICNKNNLQTLILTSWWNCMTRDGPTSCTSSRFPSAPYHAYHYHICPLN